MPTPINHQNVDNCPLAYIWRRLVTIKALVMLVGIAIFFPTISSAQATSDKNNEIRLPGGLTAESANEGWLALFDGQTLFGWKAESREVNWHVVDGVIQAEQGEVSLLRTTTEFDDYELKVDFWADEKTNSGIFLRTNPNPKNTAVDCYELNIANDNDHPFPTGSLVDHQRTVTPHRNGVWRTFHAVVEGDSITIKLDGEQIAQYNDPAGVRRGYIGLQYNAGSIKFRNVLLRPLNVPAIFNGKDLNNWDDSQTGDSKFAVNDQGELTVSGGRGQLESKAKHANFVFSLQCQTNAAGLNSGVFFRSIPGDFSNGYESQIQNQFENDDRAQPVDCGTGGIFRRQDARWVNANDKEWFTKTIVANGPHMSVWVNGYQVCDWTDRRQPHANPRKGLRKEAGTFILQGHDPTTDILFREIKVRELNKRR